MPFNPWAVLATWELLKNIGKMSLILVYNKTSPWAHIESKLDVLGVHKKLVKYVIHSFKRKN
jgi:hypothetical protein